MCLICAEYEKGKLTFNEAWNNMREQFSEDDPHSVELWIRLLKEESKHDQGKAAVTNKVP